MNQPTDPTGHPDPDATATVEIRRAMNHWPLAMTRHYIHTEPAQPSPESDRPTES